MLQEPRALALAAAMAVVAPPGAAVAGDWEIEIYGGGLWTITSSSGQATSPPPGETFETVAPGVSSRRVTSWYYGDGGMLLRQTRTSTCGTGSYTYPCSVVVGHLDPVLWSAVVGWPFSGGGGLRLGRRLGRRFTAELDIDYSRHSPTFSDATRTGIEASRASFGSTWTDLLSSLPGSSVTSQATLRDGRGHQLLATGVINVNLETGDAPKWSRRSPRRRFVSYLTFGAGIVSTGGEDATATLVGRYRFAAPVGESGAPFEETDTVTVRSSATFRTAFVAVAGLGFKQDLSTRWGIRFDARAYLSQDTTRTVMDARPSVTTGNPASAFVTNSSIGAIQFVNNSSGPYEGQPSSLSGPPIASFETFRSTGILPQIQVTLGLYLRF
jgi:hypothetical protein